jgi:hypothetical protein
MKNLLLAFVTILTFGSCDSLSKIGGMAGGLGLSNEEAGGGIKEALSNGLANAVLNLNKTDGFFGSNVYKMLLPPDAVKLENTLRTLGMGKLVDKAILQINRGAEDAVGFAKPIFVNAIKEMTLTDAINIVRGGNNAGTNYFKEKTTAALIAAFSPVIKTSLDRVEATKYYDDIVNTYNKLPTVRTKVNPDLTSFVVGKATDALFDQIAKEENNIRENPVARTTDLLKKVFGQKW